MTGTYKAHESVFLKHADIKAYLDQHRDHQLAMVTLTGGIDSTVLTYALVKDNIHPICVYVKYGSKAEDAEILAAVKTCRKLGLKLVLLELGDLYKQISQSFLIGTAAEYQTGSQFWLDGRNGLIGYLLAIWCAGHGITEVYLGINASDSDGDYLDTTEQFIAALNLLIMNSIRGYVRVYAPWISDGMTKPDIIKLGMEYGIDWVADTHSCSSSNEEPCCDYDNCESCKYRRLDFLEAGYEDPFYPKEQV